MDSVAGQGWLAWKVRRAAADVAAGAPLASFADTRLGVADGVPLGLGSVAGFGTSLRRSTRCRCNREQDYQGQMLHTWGESSVGFLTDALDCESAVTQADRTRRIGYYQGVTAEARFERIETTLEAFGKGMLVVQQTLVSVMQSAERTQDMVGKLAETVTHCISRLPKRA